MASWLDDYKGRVAQDSITPPANQRQPLAAQYASSTAHLYTIRTSVIIPLLQSLIMGLGFGAIAGVGATMTDTVIPAWFVFFVVMFIVFLISWYISLSRWAHTVGLVERLVKADITEWITELAPEPEPEEEEQKFVHVKLVSADGRQGDFFDVPDYPWMQLFARKVLNGAPLSFTEWTGRVNGISKPFTRGEFEQLQDLLIRQNLAVWRDKGNRRSGMILTLAGREVFKKLADDNYSPTLPE